MKEMLRKLGISEEEICDMMEMCPEIGEMEVRDLLDKITLLKEVNCDDDQIRDIIASNPFYLDRFDTDVRKTFAQLRQYGFERIDEMLEGDPYLLNLDDFEIIDHIQRELDKGEALEDIVDEWSLNPYRFEEL